MKQLSPLLTLLLLLLLFNTSCKKKEVAPIDQLPAATMEGKNTFGCLVNGKVFKPKGSMFSGPILESYYQLVDGEHYFHVSAADKGDSEKILDVNINTNALSIGKGVVLPLVVGNEGEATGAYAVYDVNRPNTEYRTNNNFKGELRIIHFDPEKQIVSGTFWFDAVNAKGEKVEVREGRFDMQFTK
jgi:hypothetical protein